MYGQPFSYWAKRKSLTPIHINRPDWPKQAEVAMHMKSLWRKLRLGILVTVVTLGGWLGPVAAQVAQPAPPPRPTAPELLPTDTLALVRIPDMPLLVERFKRTALGQIGQDPRMQPLVAKLFAAALEAFQQVEDEVGLPLEQILQLPQGEVCVAFVAAPDLEQEAGLALIIDTKDHVANARKLMATAEEMAVRNGGGKSHERIGDDEITVFTGLAPQRVFAFEREGTFVFCSSRPLMETVLVNWAGNGIEKTLAENDNYNTLLNRCRGAGEETPQVVWYVDPIALVRRLASGSLAATGLALFPALGLDGLRAVGGTMSFATAEYDEAHHYHILLENPRRGVIDAVALGAGDMSPPSWVPPDCVSYSTLRWNLKHTLHVSGRLVDGIMGEGALEEQIRRRVNEPLGVDFLRDIVPHVTGRISYAQWVEKPVRINSVTNMVGIELHDAQTFKPILERTIQRQGIKFTKQHSGTSEFWAAKPFQPSRRRPSETPLRDIAPCVGLLGSTLLITDSFAAYEEAVRSAANPEMGLDAALDFKLIASRISRQHGGDSPGMLQFARPEEGLRFWYDLATAEQTRERLARRAERERFFGSVQQALQDHPLPPFEVLAEYLSPGGGMITNDETGIHFMSLTLKRN